MCKIAMMSGIKPTKIKQAWELAKALAPHMSKNDDDGFGYAAITKKGQVFVERWLDNDQAFRFKANNKADKELQNTMGSAIETYGEGYSSVGVVNRNEATAIILHARMATCAKGLKNVHPFVVNDQALIHNGVISNHEEVLNKYDTEKSKLSTCDSEAIAFSYAANDVLNNPEGIKQVGLDLRGYYACAVLGKDQRGNPYMDIFKSASASLYAAYVPQIGGLVYCTSLDILKAAIKECGFIYYQPYKIKSEKLIRHNAITGDARVLTDFKEQGNSYSSYKNRWDYESYYGYSSEPYKASTEKPSGISWEEYLDKRGGTSTTQKVINLNGKVESPSKYSGALYNVPEKLLAIQDTKKREQAIQDFETIREQFIDFRNSTATKRLSKA